MTTAQSGAGRPVPGLAHRLSRMTGRSRHEEHRTATPLELFFDLTFVIAFAAASSELAHAVAEAHVAAGLASFAFCMFAIIWAWINFTWFASAYDTDDWLFRVTTMVQMVGVLILAMGIPRLFVSIEHGEHLDNGVIVLGYVVMRVAMVFQWLRAARQDTERRQTCLTYAGFILAAQAGWVALIFVHTSLLVTFLLAVPLYLLELCGPWFAERRGGTPWHAHHVAERYGLLAVIALGECLIGTIAALSAIVQEQGWSVEAAGVGLAGVGLAFGLWWVYFICPFGETLHHRPERAFPWGYGHMVVFAAIAATGAGLHVAAYYVEGEAHISATGVILSVAIPVAVFAVGITVLYALLVGFDPLHRWLVAANLAILAAATVLAASGVALELCLVVVMLAPVPTIVADEVAGARHREAALARIQGS